ncbi:MAG: hypothetical protein J5707_05330, partial [Candidatus Methanomethylophilus sp.]|nr:hypothetical protein [Methanomethylophilus sp.]
TFYDKDGTTVLEKTPENLKGGLFETVGGKLVLQSRTSPPAGGNGEFPLTIVAVAAVAILAIVGAAAYFFMSKKKA